MALLDRLNEASTSAEFKPEHPPTPEQQAIIDAAISTEDNLLISALAGAAKTSTLVMVANHPIMQAIPTLCLAFNKKIAEEMKNRLPSNCVSMTLNSLGHKVWGQAIGRRLRVDTKKNYNILKELVDDQRQDVKNELYESFSDMLRIIAHGKSSGWVPDACQRTSTKSLYEDDKDFFLSLDEEIPHIQEQIITKAALVSIEQSFQGKIDFDDQLFMSTCFPSRFPEYPLTMIDEAQDLSGLNHAMLDQIVNGNRLFAVGDPCQAIYGFRGAYGDSMDRLQHKFHMRTLTLSTSFRCPQAVVAEAQWRAPHMNAPKWAKPGEVKTLVEWSIDDLDQDAVIICRNNAPIFAMAIKLLMEGRYPQIVGNDIGKTLLKALDKLGPKNMSQAEALDALEIYRIKRLSKVREHARDSVEDFCFCLEIFIRRGETLGGAKNYAEHIMTSTGPIKMMTGHKSKGLEFYHVFILDRELLHIVEDDRQSSKNQDRNLLYVMQTRSQEKLVYVKSQDFIMAEPEMDKE